MKKSLVAALTGALVVGATATTFAAANPFSDVPAGHWAYNSVTKLTSEGVIEGYGDGTFRGNRNITRYEMAQMVARALAKAPSTDMSAASRAELQKLEAEFREELDSLGVRVEELEKHADKVKWAGKIEYTYNHHKYSGSGINRNFYYADGTADFGPYRSKSARSNHDGVFRLEPVAEINDHWKAVARFDAGFSLKDDSTNDVKLKRVYAEGDYDKFNVKLGRFGFCPSVEDGIVADTNMSGVQLEFGSKWKFGVAYGRIGGGDEPEYQTHIDTDNAGNTYRHISRDGGTTDDPTDMIAVNVHYQPGETGLYGGASYYYAKDDDFASYSKNFDGDKASIWAASLGYKFNDMLDLHGSYARNGKADFQKDAWAVDLRYGNYGDYAEKGAWAVWAGYAKFGDGAGIVSNQGDDIATGEKGWHIGAGYAPFKNVGVQIRYADAKIIDTDIKDKHFWGRVEFFF